MCAGQTPNRCAYIDVQADDGVASLAALHQTVDECHADHSDDVRYVVARVNVHYTFDFRVKQLGIFIGVRDRGVVQSRAENIAAEGDCVDLAQRPIAVRGRDWRYGWNAYRHPDRQICEKHLYYKLR